jgi:hypothetical protein
MGVCFIGERGRFGDFISTSSFHLHPFSHRVPLSHVHAERRIELMTSSISPTTGGNLVTPSGEIVGKHDGMWYYTIGQGAKVSGMGMKMFVAKKGVGVDGKDILVVPGS